MRSLAKPETIGKIISDIQEYISSYIYDQQYGPLSITKYWLDDALITLRQHEPESVQLVNEIGNISSFHT